MVQQTLLGLGKTDPAGARRWRALIAPVGGDQAVEHLAGMP